MLLLQLRFIASSAICWVGVVVASMCCGVNRVFLFCVGVCGSSDILGDINEWAVAG